MAIQNDVLQSTPLISKSLPIHIIPNGNLLLLSQIVRNQKISGGIPARDFSTPSNLNLFGYVKPQEALKRAENMADAKNIPISIREKMKKSAKESAESIKENVRELGTLYRKEGFESDRNEKVKWCAIISFCFFILGRYVIKMGKWIVINKSEN